MSDKINHPPHYGGADNPYEAIKVIEAWGLGFCLGNTVKYVARAGRKLGAQILDDLKKARWYLDREITALENIQLTTPVPLKGRTLAVSKHVVCECGGTFFVVTTSGDGQHGHIRCSCGRVLEGVIVLTGPKEALPIRTAED